MAKSVFQWDLESYRDRESFCWPDPEFKQDPESYRDREYYRDRASKTAANQASHLNLVLINQLPGPTSLSPCTSLPDPDFKWDPESYRDGKPYREGES